MQGLEIRKLRIYWLKLVAGVRAADKVAESGAWIGSQCAALSSQKTKGVIVLTGSLWSREETWKSSRQINQADFPRDKELFGQMPRQLKARE